MSSSDFPPPPPGPDPYGQAPPPPPPPPQYGYGQQPYSYGGGYPPAQETDSTAVVALVLAIASFVVCPVVPAIVALVLANNADAAIQASGGRKTGEGLTKAARIVSWINIGLCVGSLVLVIVIAVIAAAAGS